MLQLLMLLAPAAASNSLPAAQKLAVHTVRGPTKSPTILESHEVHGNCYIRRVPRMLLQQKMGARLPCLNRRIILNEFSL
jgi:hypothetical protein